MAKQIKAFDKEVARKVDSPTINVQTEFESLQAYVEALNMELLKKDFQVASLTSESEILVEDNHRITMRFQFCISAQRQDQKRKLGLI